MTEDDQNKTLLVENSFGWRLYTWKCGHRIVCPNPLWRRGLLAFAPVTLLLGALYLRFWPHYGHVPSRCPWELVVPVLLIGLWLSRTANIYIDRQKRVIQTWNMRVPFLHFVPVLYHAKRKDRYVVYVHDDRPHPRRLPATDVAWESADKAEAARVLKEAFGVVITEEDPGSFSYTQRQT